MKPKLILFFCMTNPAEKVSGLHTQLLSLLGFFKRQGVTTDFLSLRSPEEFTVGSKALLTSLGLFRDLYLLVKNPKSKYPPAYFISFEFIQFFLKRFLKISVGRQSDADLSNPDYRRQFNALLKKSAYDLIIFTDSRWAGLFSGNAHALKLSTLLITGEPGQADLFDRVWCLSSKDQGTDGAGLLYLPAIVEKPENDHIPVKDIDILYVGSADQGNKEALEWFFEQVYPLIRGQVSMRVIGKSIDFIPLRFIEVEQICHADDLSPHYRRSRVFVCPSVSPEGLFMKVAEAQAHSLPVVRRSNHTSPESSNLREGCHLAATPEEFATVIRELLENKVLYESRQHEAYAWFMEHHESTVIDERLNQALEKCRPQ